MKLDAASKKLPVNQTQWDAVIEAAPGRDREGSSQEQSQWASGVVVNGGGYKAVRQALVAKRRQGERGPQLSPTKQLVSIRYSPEVLEFFRATGSGWQARMDDVLRQWVNQNSKA